MPGVWFDEMYVGQEFDHPIRRTVTETDNVLFTAMTHNPALLHLDEEYMKGTEFGARIVNSAFTLGLMVGISVGDTTLGTAVANLGWDEVRFPKPLFHGDTVNVRTEVIELRESKSRPGRLTSMVIWSHRASVPDCSGRNPHHDGTSTSFDVVHPGGQRKENRQGC